jgi:hypothetical protein
MSPEYWYMVNGECLAFIGTRPDYCDRGRYHAVIEVGCWRSDADTWPRYYFDLERAKAEVLEYLRIKFANNRLNFQRLGGKVTTVEGGVWVKMPD